MEEPSQRVGTTVLFENDVVRVWDFQLKPGQESELHRHLTDYFFVYTTDENKLEVRVPGDQANPVSTPEGYVAFVKIGRGDDPGLTHSLANVGEKHHRQIVVELLGTRATTADGATVIQNNQVGSDAWADRATAGDES
jgi:hypothetical protein